MIAPIFTQLRHAKVVRVLLLLATWLAIDRVGWAVDESKRVYNLPAGEAAVTLRQFADVSGREVLFAAEVVRGVRTRQVRGEYSAPEAIDRMLEGTKLYAHLDERTGTLVVRLKSDSSAPKWREQPKARSQP
jgi:iron complex outermembrane recepter protein